MLNVLMRKIILEVTYYFSCGKIPFNEVFEKYNEEEIKKNQIKKLKKIVNYSYKNSGHYKYLSEIIEREKENDKDYLVIFKKLPYLEKKDIRGDSINNIRVQGIKGISRETTGSTGIPVSVYIDKHTLENQLRARWMFFSWHGIYPGAKEGRFWGRMDKLTLQSFIKNFRLVRRICG